MEAARRFKAQKRGKSSRSWWVMMIKLISNDEVDNLKLDNDEFDK